MASQNLGCKLSGLEKADWSTNVATGFLVLRKNIRRTDDQNLLSSIRTISSLKFKRYIYTKKIEANSFDFFLNRLDY